MYIAFSLHGYSPFALLMYIVSSLHGYSTICTYIYISIFTNIYIYIYIVLHSFSMSLTHVDLFPTPFMLLNFRCACLLVNYTSPAQKVVDGVGRYLSSSDIRKLKNPVELETLLSKAWATLQDAAYDSVDQKVKHKVFWQVVYQSLAFPAQKKI